MKRHDEEIRHFHLFCGLGGGAAGFNQGRASVGKLQARFRCLGGVDVDPAGIRDFERKTGVAGTVADLFDRDQYIDFHGHEPPADWREVTPIASEMGRTLLLARSENTLQVESPASASPRFGP